ncbi:MAG TPA: hypothetical protein VG844_04610 [Terracidiphilus sp.]|nr:hypothetical protein [Terracidiphilus sp.]
MQTVIWDVDDVLNDLMQQWFTLCWLPKHPDCQITYSEIVENPPHRVLGIAREQYLHSLDQFRATDYASNMCPNSEVLAWFQECGSRFRHVVLTARPLESTPDVARWVMQHFGAWVRCFGVVPSRVSHNMPVYDWTKGEYLKWLRCGDIMVDDSPENIAQAQLLGMKALLYPQPWNSSIFTANSLLKRLSDLAEES